VEGNRTVLICDDDFLARELAANALQGEGYYCLQAACEQEALAHFNDRAVDVVLMDIYLGQSNGIDCVRRIRSMPRGTDTPVVFITGSIEPLDVEKCLKDEIAASAYLNKPLVWETLPALCNSLIVSSEIKSKILKSGPHSEKLDHLMRGLGHVRQMLGKVGASEEARVKCTDSNPNLGVLVQINVAHRALLDIERGLSEVLIAPSED
jgi:CheY-like chemotaxis protein